MSSVAYLTIGVLVGLALFAAVKGLGKVHRHRWGPWSLINMEIVNRGYELTKQSRTCGTCHRMQVRGL